MNWRRFALFAALSGTLAIGACDSEESDDDDDGTSSGTAAGSTTGTGTGTGTGSGSPSGSTTGTGTGTGTTTGSGGGGGDGGGGGQGGGGGAADSGHVCADPADVSDAQSWPYELTGTFDDDTGPFGDCIENIDEPANTVWFAYTPAADGTYWIYAQNNTDTNAYSGMSVFEGLDCDPYGTEIACGEFGGTGALLSAEMTNGQPYLIQFHTDGEDYTMVDPAITIELEAEHGQTCADPEDLSGVTEWPHQMWGVFDDDPTATGSCVDDDHFNAVWLSYQPASAGTYRVIAVNGTGTYAYSRLAVFTGLECDPYGDELGCATADTYYVAVTGLELTDGEDYLILFHTDGDDYTMEHPAIIIEPDDPETECTNWVDDDWDNMPDCIDPTDCQTLGDCTPGSEALGDACTQHSDCSTNAGNDPMCADEANTGFPGGMCTEGCDLNNDDCGDDGICAAQGWANDTGACLKLCPNGDDDCRTADGYSCQYSSGLDTDICWPE